MCSVIAEVIPVMIGANRTISESFRKHVSNIPGKHEIKEIHRIAILCTAHKRRTVLL